MLSKRLSSGAFYVRPIVKETLAMVNQRMGLDLNVSRFILSEPLEHWSLFYHAIPVSINAEQGKFGRRSSYQLAQARWA